MIENESQRRRARGPLRAPASPLTVGRALLIGLVLLGAAACQESDATEGDGQAQAVRGSAAAPSLPRPFVLGFLPAQRAEEIIPDARRLADFLSGRLGIAVDVRTPTAYEPLVEGLRFHHVHAAFLDGGPAWISHRRAGAEAVLAEVKDGRTFYWAEAFVLADSPLRDLKDLAGKRVAFTSRTGSSGFLMPVGTLVREGIVRPAGEEVIHLENALRQAFAATIYSGGYRQALEAVLDGRADVAFGAHDAPERFLTDDERARIRTLHRFGRVPSHAVVVSPELTPEGRDAFVEAMLALNEESNLPLLRALYGVDGLEAVDTETHLGDFGRALSALPGMERTLLERVR